MKFKIILTLIIPVYNVEKYVSTALQSVFNNFQKNIDIIIINDGSHDASLERITEYLKKLSNDERECVNIINQRNKGISYTRNKGISLAKGDYIAFLDSDDVLAQNYFDRVIPILKDHAPDILQFDFSLFKESPEEKINSGLRMKSIGLKESSEKILLEVFNYNSWYPWSRIYKREFFNDIKFPLGYTFEDPAIIPFIFLKANNIYFLSENLYHYRINDSSITRSKSKENLNRNIKSLEYLLDTYIKQYNKNFLFYICFLHFFRIYLDYCYKFGGITLLQSGWNKYSNFMKKYSKKNNILKNLAGNIFIKINFLGYYSYFVMYLLTLLNDLKNGK